ncbi:MAG: site-specific integrase [Candidatus Nanopelagicales bacterium]
MASVRKRGGNWQVRWREDGIARSETFAKHDDAIQFRGHVDAAGQRLPQGYLPGRGFVITDTPTYTLDEWAKRSIAARASANARTRADYLRDYTNHVSSVLGDQAVAAITPQMCGSWLTDFTEQRSAKTVRNVAGMLATIFNDAVANKLIETNPMHSVGRRTTGSHEEMCFLTRDEFAVLLARIDPEFRPLTLTLVTTGLRWGEATALTVDCVHLEAKPPSLRVTRAWKKDADNQPYVGTPKTERGIRTISLDADTAAAIAPLIEGKSGNDLVFSTADGGRIPSQTYYSAQWMPAISELTRCEDHRGERLGRANNYRFDWEPCGCPGTMTKRPRPHDLRHTHVSWLIAAGVPIPAIQKRLGHASVRTTIDVYGHLMSELDDAILAAMEGAAG